MSVTTIESIGASAIRSIAGPHKTPWVHAMWISLAPGLVHQSRRTANRSGGADHVIKHQRDLAFDRATDDRALTDFQGAGATFVDDRQAATEAFAVTDGPLDTAFIGADHDDFVIGQTRD